MKQFKLHFDGGANPNPGRGYGSYELESMFSFEFGAKYSRKGSRIQFGNGLTNNQAEYYSMLHGLKAFSHDLDHGWLKEQGIYPKACGITLFSDSKLLVEQMCGRWKVKVQHIKVLHEEARALLKQFGHWNVKWNSRTFNVQRFGH